MDRSPTVWLSKQCGQATVLREWHWEARHAPLRATRVRQEIARHRATCIRCRAAS